MNDAHVFAVHLYPQAVEALGDVIKPYLSDGPAGPHVVCAEIDTGGPFFEMTLHGKSQDGRDVELEIMVPMAMVRCVIAIQGSEGGFGFG